MNRVFRLPVFLARLLASFIKSSSLGPFHAMPDKFENEIFTLKCMNVFHTHYDVG